ncbi:serine hydrolase [bacterium]|nr:MAG: serine hydrolase [bacterium]
MFRALCLNLVVIGTLAGASCAQNQTTPPVMTAPKANSPLEQRANDVVASINAPKEFDKVFSSEFMAAVPAEKLTEIFQSLTTQYGRAVRVQKVTPRTPNGGQIVIEFEKNTVAKMNLDVDSKAPNLVIGLLITAVESTTDSLDSLVSELKALPGKTALSVVKLDGEKLVPIVAHNPDSSLAIGSSFKLYVLSELVRSIAANERKWSDVVELRESSLPSGQLQNWPQGSPITLHSLASLMISISDNTATDQLISTLGRGTIEKMMTTAGNADPQRSLPFLKTVEMFKIKGETAPNFAANYAAKSPAERRKILEGEVAAFPKEKISLGFLAKPNNIDKIEWFASPNDLARVMNWLRLHSAAPDDKARGVLTINKALADDEADQWGYVGYKGGSETGVMNMTYLLQSKKGDWYVVSGGWNNDQAAVNEGQFAGLMKKAVSLLRAKA